MQVDGELALSKKVGERMGGPTKEVDSERANDQAARLQEKRVVRRREEKRRWEKEKGIDRTLSSVVVR